MCELYCVLAFLTVNVSKVPSVPIIIPSELITAQSDTVSPQPHWNESAVCVAVSMYHPSHHLMDSDQY